MEDDWRHAENKPDILADVFPQKVVEKNSNLMINLRFYWVSDLIIQTVYVFTFYESEF